MENRKFAGGGWVGGFGWGFWTLKIVKAAKILPYSADYQYNKNRKNEQIPANI